MIEGDLHSLKSEELKRQLKTQKECTYLNKKHGMYTFGYCKGEKVNFFNTKEEIIDSAKEWFVNNLVPKGFKLLILGTVGIAEPQLIIYGEGKLVKKNNELFEKRKNLTWEKNEKEMDKIMNKWKPIAKELGIY